MLNLTNAQAFMRKISINVPAQDAELTVFTIPIEGISLTREQLDEYLGEGTFESWFEQVGETWKPRAWIARLPDAAILLEEKFASDGVEIVIGKKELVFETLKAEEEGEDDQPAGRLGTLKLTPRDGGATDLAFHLQVRPGLGADNLALQKQQYGHVKLTLGNLEQIKRKARQQELALDAGGKPKGPGDDEDDEDEVRTGGDRTPRNGSRPAAGH